VYVLPKSFDSACPSGDSQKATQLASAMGQVIALIRGEKAQGGDVITEGKTGLADKSKSIADGLRTRVK
ncbi:MAG: hypothetical protein KBF88_13920, partial [Polyangiaceae bacterium]|nr:hypothetical protein [Polyangiaceae bacterium]